jgi:hypothetical protein
MMAKSRRISGTIAESRDVALSSKNSTLPRETQLPIYQQSRPKVQFSSQFPMPCEILIAKHRCWTLTHGRLSPAVLSNL